MERPNKKTRLTSDHQWFPVLIASCCICRSSIWARTKSHLRRIQRIWPLRMLDRKWRDRKSRDFSPYFFPFFIVFFPYFFPVFFVPYFPPYFFSPILFSRTFSKGATFEIQHFKISVSCFSSTCHYSTVHVPCGISIQTSPVGLPLEGWGAHKRDLKGPKINLFKPKEDWNVL
jgi:hypothetical protein